MGKIKNDNVKHPSHYADQCSMECIDAMSLILGRNGMYNYCIGNVFKYLWRHKAKNGMEDLRKANQYLEFADRFSTFADVEQVEMLQDMVDDAIGDLGEKEAEEKYNFLDNNKCGGYQE